MDKILKKPNEIMVMLVDDHPAFRKGMAALIESEPDLRVIAETLFWSERQWRTELAASNISYRHSPILLIGGPMREIQN